MANWALGKLIPQLSLRPHTVASVIDLHISANPVTESVIWWRGQWVELPAFPLCNSSHKPNMSGNSEVMFCGIFLNMPWLLILLFSLGWQYANELPPFWQSELSLHEPTIRVLSLCIEKNITVNLTPNMLYQHNGWGSFRLPQYEASDYILASFCVTFAPAVTNI